MRNAPAHGQRPTRPAANSTAPSPIQRATGLAMIQCRACAPSPPPRTLPCAGAPATGHQQPTRRGGPHARAAFQGKAPKTPSEQHAPRSLRHTSRPDRFEPYAMKCLKGFTEGETEAAAQHLKTPRVQTRTMKLAAPRTWGPRPATAQAESAYTMIESRRRAPAAKVEPISPYLMFVYFTVALWLCDRRYKGLLVLPSHGPRITPKRLAESSCGNAESSQRISVALSSHSDKASTIPRSRASPIFFRPPFIMWSSGSWKAFFCALQNSSVMAPPSTPGTVELASAMTLPSWRYKRRISAKSPVSVPSAVMN
mmetsp:Transcript_93989/g.287580  ORF Transcript_93989/g.287580 Transcript_93989/m.287580 type:complete len:311 (-) Transcript_93989:219-1151(-)